MSQTFAIKAVSPTSSNEPHILGFATARSVADDTLLDLWNGQTSASRAWKVDFEGRTIGGNGTAAKPAISFISDPDTGLYRVGANNLGIAVGGAKILDIAASVIQPGANGTVDLGASGMQWNNAWFAGGISVTGSSSLGQVTASSSLAVTGVATLSSTLSVAGGTTLSSTLAVTGAATFSSTINSQTISAAANFTGTIAVAGAATLSATLAVTSNATVGGTLGVTGKVTASAEVQIDGDLNHDGTNVGFYAQAPVARQTVTGSKAGNAALGNLMTALAALGLVSDGTS
jgi:hypothetical protein